MKTKELLTAILVTGVLITSCEKEEFNVIPSSRITTSGFSVNGINSLDASSLFHVFVNFSENEESVLIEANENLHSFIEINQDGEKLNINLKGNLHISGDPVLNIYVTTASLEEVIAEGAVKVEFENMLETDFLELELTGASQFEGSVKTGTLMANLDGFSRIKLDGSANNFLIEATGASEMTGFDFTTNILNTNLKGGSEISLTVDQKLDAVASGGSNIYYKGNPVIQNINLSGGSRIVKID